MAQGGFDELGGGIPPEHKFRTVQQKNEWAFFYTSLHHLEAFMIPESKKYLDNDPLAEVYANEVGDGNGFIEYNCMANIKVRVNSVWPFADKLRAIKNVPGMENSGELKSGRYKAALKCLRSVIEEIPFTSGELKVLHRHASIVVAKREESAQRYGNNAAMAAAVQAHEEVTNLWTEICDVLVDRLTPEDQE